MAAVLPRESRRRKRRTHEQVQFNKTRQNEDEEGKLREELKTIDQQIKKLRQSSKSSNKQGDEIQALADARRWPWW